ncbi:MAG TPA: SET domain-containing protein-lysine N-methyltransferase [Kiloniellaceae bacterium]|nr:SET domain-containing protein-lysine N-methyltransferase [Kiloniellaceae bacterium]
MFRLAKIAGKGRGLLAARPIGAGTVIERAPAVRLSPADRAALDRTALFPYCFADPASYRPEDGARDDRAGHDGLLAFGALTFCNHAANPNAAVRWESDSLGLWAELTALRDIAEGQEITLFYTNIDEYADEDFEF